MIKYFIIQHIEAILTTIGGVFAMAIGSKAASRGDHSRRTKLLKILGPCLMGFGVLRFLMESATPVEWRRVATSDGMASVEFPGAPKANDQTQTLQGQTVQTLGWVYSVPGKDISLRISYSDVPAAEAEVPVATRFDFSKQFFIGQGFQLLREETATFGGAPGYSLEMEQADGKAVMWVRIAYLGSRIYRIVGSAGAPFREDPVIPQFMQSFQIRPTTAPTKGE